MAVPLDLHELLHLDRPQRRDAAEAVAAQDRGHGPLASRGRSSSSKPHTPAGAPSTHPPPRRTGPHWRTVREGELVQRPTPQATEQNAARPTSSTGLDNSSDAPLRDGVLFAQGARRSREPVTYPRRAPATHSHATPRPRATPIHDRLSRWSWSSSRSSSRPCTSRWSSSWSWVHPPAWAPLRVVVSASKAAREAPKAPGLRLLFLNN
jgi:hypothetical protein